MSTVVRVKSRALSLDWNHLSHGPGLELISAEARVRYTAVPTPPLTQGAGESSHWTTQMASTLLHSHCLPTKEPLLLSFFACKFRGNGQGDWSQNINGTCFLDCQDICHQVLSHFWHLCLYLTVQNYLMSDCNNDYTF